jgi:hypothetical protein
MGSRLLTVLGDAVIEFELPEPQFEDLTLVNVDVVRGKGPVETEAEPLAGRVGVDGPHGFKLSAERVAADHELSKFVDQQSDRHEYYLVHLAVSFKAVGSPQLKSAEVRLSLSSVPDTPPPFALSMEPLKDGDTVSVQRTVRFGPELKLLDQVDASLGEISNVSSWKRSELAVRGLGIDGPEPAWEFTRTASQKLDGAHRLTLVVQAARGAAVSVSGVVTARARGNIPWHFERELPNPLNFATVV